MAISNVQAQHLGDGVYHVTWETDSGPDTIFHVYLDDVLVGSTPLAFFQVTLPGSTQEATVRVVEENPLALDPGDKSRFVLVAWWGVDAASYYTVEWYNVTAWEEVKRIDDEGQGWFAWQSGLLDDLSTQQFRVRAMGVNGNLGTLNTLSIEVVGNPSPPAVDWSYAAGTGKVTISAS